MDVAEQNTIFLNGRCAPLLVQSVVHAVRLITGEKFAAQHCQAKRENQMAVVKIVLNLQKENLEESNFTVSKVVNHQKHLLTLRYQISYIFIRYQLIRSRKATAKPSLR